MEYIKLKDICDLKNGYAFKSSDYVEKSDVLNCRMSNIRPNATFDAEYNPKYLPNDYAEKYKEYLLDDGDLIIAMTDLANDPKILGVPTIVYTNGYKMLLNQRVGKLLLLNERPIKKKYLKYALSVPQNRGYFKKFAGGGVQINIGKAEILNIDIPYCDIETQNKIVEVLDKAQSLIDKKKEQIELLDELVKSRFIEMFSKQNFELVKANEVCDYITKGSTPPKNEISEIKENNNDIPYLKVYNLSFNGKLLFKQKEQYIKEETHNKLLSRSKVFPGDILMNIVGPPLGKFAIVPDDFKEWNINQAIAIFRATEKINNIYLLYSLKQDKVLKPFIESAVGIRQQNISLLQCRNIEIPLPPIELQNEFAEFVTKTDSIRSKMEASLSELEDNFNSLMQKAFKGELF